MLQFGEIGLCNQFSKRANLQLFSKHDSKRCSFDNFVLKEGNILRLQYFLTNPVLPFRCSDWNDKRCQGEKDGIFGETERGDNWMSIVPVDSGQSVTYPEYVANKQSTCH